MRAARSVIVATGTQGTAGQQVATGGGDQQHHRAGQGQSPEQPGQRLVDLVAVESDLEDAGDVAFRLVGRTGTEMRRSVSLSSSSSRAVRGPAGERGGDDVLVQRDAGGIAAGLEHGCAIRIEQAQEKLAVRHVGHGRLQRRRPILDAHGGERQRRLVEQLLVEAGVQLLAQDDIDDPPE